MVDLDYLPMHKGHVWSLRGSVCLGVQSVYVVYVGNVVKLRGWDFNPAKIESGTWINLHGSLALEPRIPGYEWTGTQWLFFLLFLILSATCGGSQAQDWMPQQRSGWLQWQSCILNLLCHKRMTQTPQNHCLLRKNLSPSVRTHEAQAFLTHCRMNSAWDKAVGNERAF